MFQRVPVLSFLLILSFALMFSASAQAPKGNKTEKDKKSLQGKWELVSQFENGKETFNKDGLKFYYVFDGDKCRSEWADLVLLEGTFRIDPSKSPKTIDVMEPGRTVILGLYQVQENELRVCTPDADDNGIARPTKFASTDVYSVLIFKRVRE